MQNTAKSTNCVIQNTYTTIIIEDKFQYILQMCGILPKELPNSIFLQFSQWGEVKTH